MSEELSAKNREPNENHRSLIRCHHDADRKENM